MIVTTAASPVDVIETNAVDPRNEWDAVDEPFALDAEVLVSNNPDSDYPEVWKSTIDSNSAGYPPDCLAGQWMLVGYSDPYLMFDKKRGPGTSTENADLLDVTVGCGLMDTLGLVGTVCNEIEVTVTDLTTGAVVYSEVISMRDDEVYDYYDYCFADYSFKPSLYRVFPKFYDATMRIEMRYEGQTAACSVCVVGSQKDLGVTEFGTSVQLNDYSSKITDDLGRTDLNEGRYSMLVDTDVEIEARYLDRVVAAVAAVRGKPALWQINNVDPRTGELCTDHRVLLLYGYCRGLDIILPSTVYKGSIEIMELA